MTNRELAELISEYLPISIEDAEDFIDATQKAYTWGNIDYARALSMRDKVIERLQNENLRLMKLVYKSN